MKVPSERTTITGCWAAAKSPTTGTTLMTNGVCEVSETNACWPLKSVTLGACSTLLRLSPWAALMKKNASTSLRMANPNEAGRGVEAAELRRGQCVAALRDGDVQIGGEHAR